MSWKETLEECNKYRNAIEEEIDLNEYDEYDFDPVRFAEPLSDADIKYVEGLIGSEFPDDYKSMLREFEHINDEYIWSVDLIVSQNMDLREIQKRDGLYRSFDDLIFFGGPGSGDQFAVAAKGASISPGTYIWSHENDSRNLISESLKEALIKIYQTNCDAMLDWC